MNHLLVLITHHLITKDGMEHNPVISGGSAYLAIANANNPALKRQRVRQFFVNIGASLCNACCAIYPSSDFFKDKSRASGLSNLCKTCSADQRKKHYYAHTEESSKRHKEYAEKNKEQIKANQKIYYEKNKESILKRNASYFLKNKAKIIEQNKQHAEKNKDLMIARRREYKNKRYQSDPIYRLKRNVCRAIHASITRNGYTKRSKTYEILGCTMDEFRLHIERQFTKGMTWEKVGSEIHIDHIVPLASAKTEEDILALNHHTNLRPCWADENFRKRDSIEFLL